MKKYLSGKKILITAGPTWVPIDKVRAITNVFGGALGFIMAETAYKMGADVTLLFGPGRVCLPFPKKKFQIIKFKYFDELLKLVKKEVGSKKYNAVIHSAAVSDYTPVIAEKGKIKSGKKKLIIKLKPTIKIVDLIKKIDPDTFLVKFKLEVNLPEKKLIDVARKSMISSNADMMVANSFNAISTNHKAFIIDKSVNIKKVVGKKNIADSLLRVLSIKMKDDARR